MAEITEQISILLTQLTYCKVANKKGPLVGCSAARAPLLLSSHRPDHVWSGLEYQTNYAKRLRKCFKQKK